jgi:predicted transcriptional regulator
MNGINTKKTDLNTTAQNRNTLSELKPSQQATIRLLTSGKSISGIARELGIGRTTIHSWLKDDQFQQALDEVQEDLQYDRAGAVKDELSAFEKVESTPLLSLPGIRARIELLDRLIIADLREKSDKRTRLISRLESSINQAHEFIQKVSSDEAASELVEQRTHRYCEAVLRIVRDFLRTLPQSDTLLKQFQKRLDEIDLISGVTEK